MFYKLKKDTFVRNYDDIGYITSTGIFNDRVVNGSGAVLLSVLSRKPQSLEQLVEKSSSIFSNVSIDRLKKDAEVFYKNLSDDGFILCGDTVQELENNNTGFSYKEILPKTIKEDFTPTIQRADTSTQEYLEKLLNYIIFIGAAGLTIVAVIPFFFNGVFGANVSFGGTSIIIVVGVVLETLKQIESRMLVRNYKGFLSE